MTIVQTNEVFGQYTALKPDRNVQLTVVEVERLAAMFGEFGAGEFRYGENRAGQPGLTGFSVHQWLPDPFNVVRRRINGQERRRVLPIGHDIVGESPHPFKKCISFTNLLLGGSRRISVGG